MLSKRNIQSISAITNEQLDCIEDVQNSELLQKYSTNLRHVTNPRVVQCMNITDLADLMAPDLNKVVFLVLEGPSKRLAIVGNINIDDSDYVAIQRLITPGTVEELYMFQKVDIENHCYCC